MAWNPPRKNSESGTARGRRSLPGLPGLMSQGPGPLAWVALCLGAWLALSTVVIVALGQRSVVSRLGQPVRVLQPGLHLKLPWPMERVIGLDMGEKRALRETLSVVTHDPAMFDLPVEVSYDIDEPLHYVASGQQFAQDSLSRLAREAMLAQTGNASLADMAGRAGTLPETALKTLQARAKTLGIGLRPLAVSWAAPELPTAVRNASDAMKAIHADRDKAVAAAAQESERQRPQIEAEANALVAAARRERDSLVLNAQADAAHFRALAPQYEATPQVTRDVVLQSALAVPTATTVANAATPASASTVSNANITPAQPVAGAASRDARAVDRKVDRSVDRSVTRARGSEGAQR